MEEASQSIENYSSVEDVFTRALKPGMRDIKGDVTSCCDGTIARLAPADKGMALQIKGFTYSLSELVFGTAGSDEKLNYFYTTYLAPHNYHRVHSPISGKVNRVQYFAGEFWPVNLPFVKCVPNLFFSRNERVVFEIEPEFGGRVWVVMVAALNVGRIRLAKEPSFLTNIEPFKVIDSQPQTQQYDIKIGEELGTFLLGSTAVVVFDEKASSALSFETIEESSKIMLGNQIAHLKE